MTQYLDIASLNHHSSKLECHNYYLEKSKEKYGETFDYSNAVFHKPENIIQLTCIKHNAVFTVSQRNHFRTNHGGCSLCNEEQNRSGRIERFLEVAKTIHGEKFDYTQLKDASKTIKLDIVCKKHGLFTVAKAVHLSQPYGGCDGCHQDQKATTKGSLIKDRLEKKHNNRFDYTNTDFSAKPLIQVRCKAHGVFYVELNLHKRSVWGGCKDCLSQSSTNMAIEAFKKRAVGKFGDHFCYAEVKELPKTGKIPIKCKVHGVFHANHLQHILSDYGACSGCKIDNCNNKALELIERERGVDFINSYDYRESRFTSLFQATQIVCKEHGVFNCSLDGHIKAVYGGCLQCKAEGELHDQNNKQKNKDKELADNLLTRLKSKYGDKYNYTNTVFSSESAHIEVECAKHGVFVVKKSTHLYSPNGGCDGCNLDKDAELKLSRFVLSATRKHGDKFNYKLVSLEEMEDGIVTVECKVHGVFKVNKYYHIKEKTGLCQGCVDESKRLVKEKNYIKIAKKKHPNGFDYSGVYYQGKNTEIEVKCIKHGEFKIIPSLHLVRVHGGCVGCKQDENISLQTSKYVGLFEQKYGDKYNYSEVSCIRSTDRVRITCKAHGEFKLTALAHLNGSECPSCEKLEKYLKLFKEKYGDDKFDYSQIKTVSNMLTRLPITCIKHEHTFMQSAVFHLKSNGCKCCIREEKINSFQNAAISKLRTHLGDNYDLSESRYNGHHELIEVRCKSHGVFERKYSAMLKVKEPCFKCDAISIVDEKTESMLVRFKKIHGEKYDFSNTVVSKRNIKVSVRCYKHGVFEITPERLLEGCGCPKCYLDGRISRTREEWIELFKSKHGNKYAYHFLPERILKNKPITVTCLKHSNFVTRPDTHLESGCPSCKRAEEKTLTFWRTIKENYGEKLVYKHFDVIEDYQQKVVLTCVKHGEFSNTARNLMRSKESCPTCRSGMNTQMLKEHIIKKLGDKMIVTTVSFTGWKKPVRLHCRYHGAISTTAMKILSDSFDCKWCKLGGKP